MSSAFEVVGQVVHSNPTIESLALVTYLEGPNWRELPQTDRDSSPVSLSRGISQDRGKRVLREVSRNQASAESLRDLTIETHELLGSSLGSN